MSFKVGDLRTAINPGEKGFTYCKVVEVLPEGLKLEFVVVDDETVTTILSIMTMNKIFPIKETALKTRPLTQAEITLYVKKEHLNQLSQPNED